MFGSEILEIGIGLAFVYLLMSLICSVVNEWISGLMGLRAKNLEAGIKSLFSDGKFTSQVAGEIAKSEKFIADAIYDHGLIKSLYRTGEKPAYIPSNLFAMALLDTLAPTDGTPKTIEGVRSAVANLPAGAARQALLTLVVEAGNDVNKARRAIENWYNDGMDRVAGWYKRKTQMILVCLALALTVITNTDTIAVVKALVNRPALRASTLAVADQYVHNHPASGAQDSSAAKASLEGLREQLQSLSLPVGWNPCPKYWPSTILGWVLTTIAVSLGAPFWFDVLNKFMVVRSTIKPKEKSQDEASKDATKV
jgi:hypothetical protein